MRRWKLEQRECAKGKKQNCILKRQQKDEKLMIKACHCAFWIYEKCWGEQLIYQLTATDGDTEEVMGEHAWEEWMDHLRNKPLVWACKENSAWLNFHWRFICQRLLISLSVWRKRSSRLGMHNTMTLKLMQLNGIQLGLILLHAAALLMLSSTTSSTGAQKAYICEPGLAMFILQM